MARSIFLAILFTTLLCAMVDESDAGCLPASSYGGGWLVYVGKIGMKARLHGDCIH
jgi:hypothetical protein